MRKKKRKRIVHEPVLVEEVLHFLQVDKFAHLKSQARFIDATIGNAGHSVEFVKRGINVLGIDTDLEMIKLARKRLQLACPPHLLRKVGSFKIVHGNFKDIKQIVDKYGFESVEGILFDLGVSTYQLKSQTKGLSFGTPDAPLDMRLQVDLGKLKAKDILNLGSKAELMNVFLTACEYKEAKRLTNEIVKRRKTKSFDTVGDFLSVVESSRLRSKNKLHSSTLPFMALRIKVNNELENLSAAIPQAVELLKNGGRLAVISFHSGEDKIVKNTFSDFSKKGLTKLITKKPVKPSKSEIILNRKSRSAKLRVIEKSV
ncbi:MAG: 16S rRNA (cytosine(1402)-N(4))-methyltransferase RsmH [Candidatus Hodarchaeales archaeon]|jgi:16S rRNA (cytosine1402-N4)-methyltransferase